MGLMMLLSYKCIMDVTMKRGGYGGFAAKAKHTNHLLKIAYISGICINMAHPIFGVINTDVYQ